MRKSILIYFVLFFLHHGLTYSQDSVCKITHTNQISIRKKSFIIPLGLVGYGIMALNNQSLLSINTKIQNRVLPDDIQKKNHIDNYTQFTPGLIALGLNASGIKGKHSLKDAAIIYALSNMILNALVIPTKKITQQLRPDGSAYSSFPSGHTSEAFASAELLRLEYENVSPLLGIAGYAMAGMTGYLRMYNNKHWFNDVVAGAGVGIASTKLAYVLYSGLLNREKIQKNKKSIGIVLPFYHQGTAGLSFSKIF